MWQKAYELFGLLFTVTHRLNQHDDEIETLQKGLHTLSDATSRLYFEQARTNDELKYQAGREVEARKLLQAEVEIQLLRAGRSLPPAVEAQPVVAPAAPTQKDEIAQLKTQVIELWAAIRKAEAQRTHDQAEIETLKAQVATLLNEPPKKDS